MIWTVARFPNGSWMTGGTPNDPAYKDAKVFRVEADTREKAKRKAQRIFKKRALKSGYMIPL